jgi:hypothetical protein
MQDDSEASAYDYANAGKSVDPNRLTVIDHEITTANEVRRRLALSLSDLAKVSAF